MTVALIDSNNLRNKTIRELKIAIFENKKRLGELQSKKIHLNRIRESKKVSSGPVALIYERIFNTNRETEEKLNQYAWDEDAIKENLAKLEQAIRMKELAAVNEWWRANEETIQKLIQPARIQNYKAAIFQQLIEALEQDEAAFIQTADKIILELSLNSI